MALSHKKSPEKFPGLLSHSRKAKCKNLLKTRRVNHCKYAVQIESQSHSRSTPTICIACDKHRLVHTHTVREIKLEHVSARLNIKSHRETVVEIAVSVQNGNVFHVQRGT